MKRIIVTSLSALFALTTPHSFAQSPELLASNNINSNSQETRVAKNEMKNEKKAIRKLEGSAVSTMTKNSFYKDFGDMPGLTWSRLSQFDRASFTKDGQQQYAFYDYDSKLVGTVSPKTFADMPARAQKEFNTKYKNYAVESVILFDDNEYNDTDMILYGNQFSDEDNYFVELRKDGKAAVYQVSMDGDISFFANIP